MGQRKSSGEPGKKRLLLLVSNSLIGIANHTGRGYSVAGVGKLSAAVEAGAAELGSP